MKRYLVDTDILSLFLQRQPEVVASVERHDADYVSTSIITFQEIWDGWMAALAKSKTADRLGRVYRRFTDTLDDLKPWQIETFATPAILRYESLKKQKLNVGAKDLKIAAIALETARRSSRAIFETFNECRVWLARIGAVNDAAGIATMKYGKPVQYKGYVAGWLDSSIHEFLEGLTSVPASMAFALLTCLNGINCGPQAGRRLSPIEWAENAPRPIASSG